MSASMMRRADFSDVVVGSLQRDVLAFLAFDHDILGGHDQDAGPDKSAEHLVSEEDVHFVPDALAHDLVHFVDGQTVGIDGFGILHCHFLLFPRAPYRASREASTTDLHRTEKKRALAVFQPRRNTVESSVPFMKLNIASGGLSCSDAIAPAVNLAPSRPAAGAPSFVRRKHLPHHQERHQPKQRDSANGVERDFHLTFSGGEA